MINMIAAVSQNGYIGLDGKLPWHLPEDMRLFVSKTKGAQIIMGRKTFESINSKPLPNRRNIVITRSANILGGLAVPPGVEIYDSVAEALDTCDNGKDTWIVGGERIYESAMEFVDEIHLTIVPHWIEASLGQESARFPWINPLEFKQILNTPLSPEKLELKARVIVYERISHEEKKTGQTD